MSTPARATDIVFTRHGARRGFAWLVEAYAMFKRARVPWLVLMVSYWVIVAFSTIHFIGQLAFLLLRPVLAVGLLAAAWTQERGGRPNLSHLVQGFRANLRALIPLGLMFVVGVSVAVLATGLFDGGLLLGVISGEPVAGDDKAADAKTTEELIRSGKLQGSMLIAAALALPTILALWFAPALVAFQEAGPRAALGASLRATLANWRPLLVYGLTVLLFGMLLPLIIAQLVIVMFPNPTTFALVRLVFLAYGLMFAATLHISDYVSYRDIFHAGETLAPLGAK